MRSPLRNRNIAGVAAGIGAVRACLRTHYEVRGKTVFITGGSRGLGLVLAREFAALGAKVAIAARDAEALQRAVVDIRRFGGHVLAVETDITMREEADMALNQIRKSYGPVDILVNNAGTICVGPLEAMTIDDFRDSINTHFWGPYFATMAVLQDMQRRKQGRIINISSIGGKISVPHLLPYSVGKFALTGFSQGLRSALAKDNIRVTTVCPGLMRTGSPRNALFKGNNEAEYAWYSISDDLPVLSMSVERAARRIVRACMRGEAEVVISLPAKVAVKFNALFPESPRTLWRWRIIFCRPRKKTPRSRRANRVFRKFPSWVTTLNERAGENNNQVG